MTGMTSLVETIKSILLDFQESPLETGVPRRLKIHTVRAKASVCIGVRRSGKSTYLFQIIQGLLNGGVSGRNILYLNFFDDRLHHLKQDNLGLIMEAYYSLYPEKKNTETVYCFFDEIQTVDGWESFIDRIMRTETCEVYLTGSSARMLSREIATKCAAGPFRGKCFLSPFGNSWNFMASKAREIYPQRNGSTFKRPSRPSGKAAYSRKQPAFPAPSGLKPIRNISTPSCFGIWSNGMTFLIPRP
jgi:uncharacterized protein YerC